MNEIATTEPSRLRVGDTWKWKRTLADYPAGDWVLKYRFKHPTAVGFEIISAASGPDHAVTVPAATSAGYAPGDWSWQAWVEGGDAEKYTIGAGYTTLDSDYRSGVAATSLDGRSHARRTLCAIESWIERRNPGVESYEIAGRQMRYIPIAELLRLRQYYKVEVDNEEAAVRLSAGLAKPNRIQFRV
jgi:hypothetical protein